MVIEMDAGPREGAPTRQVVTAFLEHNGRILLLRRSPLVRSFGGRWAAVSGSIPPGTSPLEQAYQEISEEVGLARDQVAFVRRGPPMLVRDSARTWLIHPMLFRTRDPSRVRLNWENTEARWAPPSSISGLVTVPDLHIAWELLSPWRA